MIRTWNPNTIQPNKHACRPLHVQDNAFRFRLSFRSMATMKDKSSKRIQSESLIEQDVVEETIDDEKDGQRLSKVDRIIFGMEIFNLSRFWHKWESLLEERQKKSL